MEWHEDHVIDTVSGVRYALSVEWSRGIADESLPSFLIITQEERRKAWENHVFTDPNTSSGQELWKKNELVRREAAAEAKRQKNAAAFARMQAKHPGQKYDRKLKQWVTVAVKDADNVD